MGLVEEAFLRLYPEKEFYFDAMVKYTDRFSPYNANVKKRGSTLWFGLSRKWKEVDREIRIGLLQDLLLKILHDKNKKRTTNIDLYNSFIKNLHISISKNSIEPLLLEAFERVNEKYFYGMVEMPNLVWKGNSGRHLATYDYHTDTVSLSNRFREAPQEIIDYLVYHELLHKKLKFSNTNGRTIHHGYGFRKLEKEFERQEEVEKEMQGFLRRKRRFGFL